MKNAMKKLTSLLLVAVLLVGALPFAASAVCPHVDVVYEMDANGNPTKWVTCQVNPETNTIFPEYISQVAAAIGGLNPAIIGWTFGSQSTNSLAAISFQNVETAVNVYPVFAEKVVPATYSFTVIYGDQRDGVVTREDGATLSLGTPTKTGRLFQGWYLPDGTKVEDHYVINSSWNGLTVTAKWEIVGCVECNEVTGHKANCSKNETSNGGSVSGSTSGSTAGSTASSIWVDVIIDGTHEGGYYRCFPVNGKITETDRNAVASRIVGKGITGWKRADNGTTSNSLLNFDFTGLAAPINVEPQKAATTPVIPNTPNNGTTNNGTTNNGTTNPGYVADEEFQHDIWLYIYVNNDMITPAKRILLNNYAIVDASQDGGILTKAEILSVVDDYYKATDANKGIIWQGAYRENSLDIVKFVFKNDETPFVSLAAERTASTVVIKARVTGVTAINSATADSSNPKTGDSIFTAMTVMGLSAASLAAVMFVYNKKRQTV